MKSIQASAIAAILLMLLLLSMMSVPSRLFAADRQVCPPNRACYTPNSMNFVKSSVSKNSALYAAPQARGRVMARRKMPKRIAKSAVGDQHSAQIIKKTFKRIGVRQGHWRGYVIGDGHVVLSLQILRNGHVESVRYMGQVSVSENEKPTSFNFRAPIPSGGGWSWQVIARLV